MRSNRSDASSSAALPERQQTPRQGCWIQRGSHRWLANQANQSERNRMSHYETAIIGAGPYGLSLAAHLRHRGLSYEMFGQPMQSWSAFMPKGMLLKSEGFASN